MQRLGPGEFQSGRERVKNGKEMLCLWGLSPLERLEAFLACEFGYREWGRPPTAGEKFRGTLRAGQAAKEHGGGAHGVY